MCPLSQTKQLPLRPNGSCRMAGWSATQSPVYLGAIGFQGILNSRVMDQTGFWHLDPQPPHGSSQPGQPGSPALCPPHSCSPVPQPHLNLSPHLAIECASKRPQPCPPDYNRLSSYNLLWVTGEAVGHPDPWGWPHALCRAVGSAPECCCPY